VHPEAEMHTPYGATEALPVATIEAQEVLTETAQQTNQGAGVCVGRKYDSVEWKVIAITDEPISDISEAEELPAGEIGELIVRAPQVSPQYLLAEQTNELAKIADGGTVECGGGRVVDAGSDDADDLERDELPEVLRESDGCDAERADGEACGRCGAGIEAIAEEREEGLERAGEDGREDVDDGDLCL